MNNNETIHERITQLVDTFGKGKNTVFASLIGSNEANVRGYKTSVMPKFDFLEKIARSFDIDLKWLLTGEGSMFRDSQAPAENQPTISSVEESIIYKMYEKEKEGKEALIKENGCLEERIRTLESKIQEYESQLEASKDEIKVLGYAKDVTIKKPSSPNADNATSANVP